MKNTNFLKKSIEQLKASGFRITKPRLFVLELLGDTLNPLTSQEIYENISDNGDSIDLVSVYRTLEVLDELNLVHRDAESGGYFPCSHCKSCPENVHIFLKCVDCANVREVDFHGELFTESFKKKLAKLNSKPSHEVVYLSDLCSACN